MTTPQQEEKGEREASPAPLPLTAALTSGLDIRWRKYSKDDVFMMFSSEEGCNLPSIISPSRSKTSSRRPSVSPLSLLSLSNFFHAPRPARTPGLYRCVPAYQQACRPVQERHGEEERKREGSQLRLGNGRVNVSVCVCV